MSLSDPQLVQTLRKAGFRGKALQTAYGIAKRESGGRADAYNGDTSTGDRSYGLFQINMLGSLGPSRMKSLGLKSERDLLNPLINARSAFKMSKGGTDFGAWGIGVNAYRSGAGYDTIAKYVQQFPGVQPASPQAPQNTPNSQNRSTLTRSQPNPLSLLTQNRRMTQAQLLGSVLNYATEGRVDSNIFANQVQAVDPKGTVEVPVKRTKRGDKVIPGTGSKVARALAFAHEQVGKPYVFGSGADYSSFDCSDLVQAAYKQIGIDIPRVTGDLIKVGRPVKWGQFKPGDLIFSNGGGHVVMYVGNGKVIAAPHTGTVVQYQPVSRFKNSFVTAKRIL